ncbi:hypothetical protein CQW23_30954 [Capsicum baccatum]|uniref:Uncharacterized protein n=1 Tax=Capsicum baccatum TaxID=33114 RepID=A0A2G2V924_CAPBA|nr:hypothetical protein CQW23_30954 [Capsicum baccatum]
MNDSSSREMNVRQPQMPCGCVGIFFQLFDRNRRFAKMLFPKKLLSPASKKFGGDKKQPKLHLVLILNSELIFGTIPQQQALPVEDRFSVSHFLLNEHEMLSSFLWMAFSEFLGCNDPKPMNQLKGFAFDFLLEYLD